MGAYIDVNEADFEASVVKADTPVLVDFWAPWCGPCRAIARHVETIGEEYAGRVKVAKVNVDNNQGIAAQYGIRGIPALLLFKDGQVVNQMQGMPPNPLGRLRTLVDSAL